MLADAYFDVSSHMASITYILSCGHHLLIRHIKSEGLKYASFLVIGTTYQPLQFMSKRPICTRFPFDAHCRHVLDESPTCLFSGYTLLSYDIDTHRGHLPYSINCSLFFC